MTDPLCVSPVCNNCNGLSTLSLDYKVNTVFDELCKIDAADAFFSFYDSGRHLLKWRVGNQS